MSNSTTSVRNISNSTLLDDLEDLVNCLVTGRASLSMKTKLLTALQKKNIYPKLHASMRWVTDLLVGGGSYRLQHNRRGAKGSGGLIGKHGVIRSSFQIVKDHKNTGLKCIELFFPILK